MRVWGRTYDSLGNPTWVAVETGPDGFDDYVYATALCQAFRLNLAESPFWANFGIPAHQSIIQQVAPDFNVQFMASYFSQFFASLIVSRVPISPPPGTSRATPQNRSNTAQNVGPDPGPVYYAQALLHDGTPFRATIAT